ncbi:MAG: hypothetical protein GY940_05455 [bacterium]|nr:hypothetical protein [bacterium]
MQQTEALAMIIVMPTFLFFSAWVIRAVMDWRRFKAKLIWHEKLLDKFGNVEDLKAFLETGSGDKMINSFTVENQAHSTREKLMGSMTKSIVLVSLGAAFFVISGMTIPGFGEEVQNFSAVGIIAFSLGLGFLVSTILSFILSKKWGIINGD